MKTPKPPFIAAWFLDRLGADPRMEAIAGDLLEQYRLGRSRFWYWREAITAIVAGMWCGFRGHKLLIGQALAAGWVLTYVTVWIVGPVESSLVDPYISLIFPRLYDSELLMGTLRRGPWCALTGWVVARLAFQSRIPAVLGFTISFLFLGLTGNVIFLITRGDDPRFIWMSLPGLAFLTILILLGGGLLTGPPKRSSSESKDYAQLT
jgi:hypothetical protein